MRIFALLLCLFISTSSFAAVEKKTSDNKIKYVIYVTLDGTRWQDIYEDHSHLKKFWERHSQKMQFYGAPGSRTDISVASIPVSLPSYQSQMSGSVQPCLNNECGRITVQTLPETIKQALGLRAIDVAVFSSWYDITYAVERVVGTVFSNTGNFPVYDPILQAADEVMYELNVQQENNPHGITRYDKYTYAQAIHYFEKFRPRFLWISLDNADGAAHSGDLEGYHQALAYYDDMLDSLFIRLKIMGIENETMVIVTTDHGRGDGEFWTEHGIRYRASSQTWAFVMNGALLPDSTSRGTQYFSTLSIRPTIQAALGI